MDDLAAGWQQLAAAEGRLLSIRDELGRLRASRRRSATQRDLLVGTALFGLLNKVFACLENAQQDAQLPWAVFPRVPAPVVEHRRYNSSRKRRHLNQPATILDSRKDPRISQSPLRHRQVLSLPLADAMGCGLMPSGPSLPGAQSDSRVRAAA
jgi:hypothetical protein